MSTPQETAAKETLLVVDDEVDLCDMLVEYLGKQGFRVLSAHTATQAMQTLEKEPVSLMILDINMPGGSGLDLLRQLPQPHAIPVILLTANTDVVDRVVGLELGADDYIGKPFDLRELLARIRSVTRRTQQAQAAAPAAGSQAATGQTRPRVRFGVCELDIEARRLYNALGEEVPLTAMEFDLLQAFAAHPNRVLSRDTLLELAHHRGSDPFDRSIDIRITRLRRKIEQDPAVPQVIKTIRGFGYLFSTHTDA